MDFLIPLGIGLIVGLIVLASLLSQLKSVAQKHEASDYVTPNSLKLSVRNDRFIDKHTERQMIRQMPAQAPGGAPGHPGNQGAGPHPGIQQPASSHLQNSGPKPPQQGSGLTIVDRPKQGK